MPVEMLLFVTMMMMQDDLPMKVEVKRIKLYH